MMEPESLTPTRWQQIEELYHAALERAPDERAAFLAEACAGDEELRREVESLLRSDAQAGSFIEEPALDVAARLESEEPARSLTGQQLDHYQIFSLLGAGGMGEVYRAKDTRLDREVAIKVLPAHLARDSEALARFQREARAVAALSHPNILAIHDFGTDQGISYAVTELLEGETLRECLRRSPLPWRKAVEIGIGVADGLSAAHAKGIIHRDLKPENIFLTADGRVKILDFGLARVKPLVPEQKINLASTSPLLTRPGLVMGTVGYMSPEQVRGEVADAPSDIFLLGCVLYEMITGQRAFARTTAVEELAAILKEDPPEMADSAKRVPPELEYIVSHCLEKKPQDRFQSAQDLAFALRTISLNRSGAVPSLIPSRYRFAVRIVSAVAILLLATLLLLFSGLPDWWSDSRPIRSLAVLPLKNDSQSPAEDYFADGMTDELISSLMKVGSLRVISRTSVTRYRETGKSLPEIARDLKVDAVVEGSVRRAGEKMRISVRLFRSASEQSEWSQTYERELRDILVLQSRVAQDIAREIRIQTTPQEQARLAQVHSADPEAFQLYLKGRYLWQQRTSEGLGKAIDYFQQAIAKDPNYALAWAGLADAYILRESMLSPAETMLKAREAATRALAIDNSLAEAHTSLAVVNLLYEWNWSASESEFRQAIALKPSYATAHHWFAEYLSAMGRHEEALAEIKQAQELDPYSLVISRDVGRHYYLARQYEQAIAQCRNALELEPNSAGAHRLLGLALAKKEMFTESIWALQRAVALSPSSNNQAVLGYTYALSGRREEAQQILRMLDNLKEEQVSPFWIATIYAGLSDRDEAIALLEKAYQERSTPLVYLKVYPILDNLRSDPRFDDLLRRLRFPDAADRRQ
jgi:serine/threonine-protein kinase